MEESMKLSRGLNLAVNAVIVSGFILIAAGVLYWLYGLVQKYQLSLPIVLASFGFVILLFGLIGARLATALE